MKSPNDPQDHKNLMIADRAVARRDDGMAVFLRRAEAARRAGAQRIHQGTRSAARGRQAARRTGCRERHRRASPQRLLPAGQPAQGTNIARRSLKASPRLAIKTPSLEGSFALKGGRLDDLVLAKYRETVDPNSAEGVRCFRRLAVRTSLFCRIRLGCTERAAGQGSGSMTQSGRSKKATR